MLWEEAVWCDERREGNDRPFMYLWAPINRMVKLHLLPCLFLASRKLEKKMKNKLDFSCLKYPVYGTVVGVWGSFQSQKYVWVHKPAVRQGCWEEKLHITAADCSSEQLNCSCRKELQARPSDQLEWVSLVMEYITDLRCPVIEWGSQVSFSASYYSHDTSQNIVYNVLHVWEYPSLLIWA